VSVSFLSFMLGDAWLVWRLAKGSLLSLLVASSGEEGGKLGRPSEPSLSSVKGWTELKQEN